MLGMLLAWNEDGVVIDTLDALVQHHPDGHVSIVDFAAEEAGGRPLLDFWRPGNAVGSGQWPEWLGAGAVGLRVELEPGWTRTAPRGSRPDHRVRALVSATGQRRERAPIEGAIAERIAAAAGEPADIRDLVGGPERPLLVVSGLEVEAGAVDSGDRVHR